MATTDDTHTPGYSAADSTDAILKRLRRVEGQVRGIAGMVEDERYCITSSSRSPPRRRRSTRSRSPWLTTMSGTA